MGNPCVKKLGQAARSKVTHKGKVKDRICKVRNDQAFQHKGKLTYRLHNCDIAKVDKRKRTIKLNTCGWRTPTTKARMNEVLKELGSDKYVKQKKGVWYLDGQKYDDGDIAKY